MCAVSAAGLLTGTISLSFDSLTEDAMQAELINIPTDSLIDMLFVILTCNRAATTHDGTEITLIKRELEIRGEDQYWNFCIVN
jgi:hypothetical protein